MTKLRSHLAALVAVAGLVVGLCLHAPAQAGALLDTAENKVLDNVIRGQTNTFPATHYLALGTNACSDAGSPTEPSGNGYARASVAASLAAWAGTQSAGSTTASSGSGGTTSNNGAVTYSTSTGAWASSANLVSVWFMDASSGGNPWICITLTTPVAVTGSGFTLSFPAASLTFQIDN